MQNIILGTLLAIALVFVLFKAYKKIRKLADKNSSLTCDNCTGCPHTKTCDSNEV